ncbi:MAG: protein kinase [Deltaproteobacteria bacterium]|jgi:serine/threonine-protein kinase|nr:protein kinase [Deltaproteobacteria bacterium]MBW2534883.1 protein kinase [Deltaproteobacteria bacterium]
MSGVPSAGGKGRGLPPKADLRTTDPSAAPAPGTAPPSSASAKLPKQGDLIGNKYRLKSLIAKGGMATVWLAYNETLDVQVAIKFIRTDLAGPKDDRLADRLLQEARATARLGHPSIVRVQDFGKTDSGVPYLVMELLEGESLDVALGRRGRIAARKAVRALLPVAHALATAHDRGIIHRDLKPENIFLTQTSDGRVQPKLIDFGISRINTRGGKRLTFIGEAVGTPAYMSPEQVYGEEIDHRADIWAFSVLLYESITGRLPFQGSNITATARAITRDAPAPIGELSAGDDHLWGILLKGLAKPVAERWTTMRELGSELACWLIDRGITEDVSGASLEATWLVGAASSSGHDAFASVPPPTDRRQRESPRPGPAAVASQATPTPTSTSVATPVAPPVLGDLGRQPTEPASEAIPRAPDQAANVEAVAPAATASPSNVKTYAIMAAVAMVLLAVGVALGLVLGR